VCEQSGKQTYAAALTIQLKSQFEQLKFHSSHYEIIKRTALGSLYLYLYLSLSPPVSQSLSVAFAQHTNCFLIVIQLEIRVAAVTLAASRIRHVIH